MSRRPRLLAALVLSALISACAQATELLPPAQQPASTTPRPPTVQSVTSPNLPTTTPIASKTATVAKPTATRTRSSSAAVDPSLPALTLKVTSPSDESVVNVRSTIVTGETIPGAVVSVNGELADVDAGGKFRLNVPLEEGPNVLEIVASDDTGSERATILRLIYEP